jgi:hypothetical protein
MSHTISNQPGAPTCLAMSELTIKMPDPIIEPATRAVESNRVRLFRNEESSAIRELERIIMMQ